MQKFPHQGLNRHHSNDLSHCSENTRFLTCWTTQGFHSIGFQSSVGRNPPWASHISAYLLDRGTDCFCYRLSYQGYCIANSPYIKQLIIKDWDSWAQRSRDIAQTYSVLNNHFGCFMSPLWHCWWCGGGGDMGNQCEHEAHAVMYIRKSCVSDPGVLCLLSASMKLWQLICFQVV